MERIITLIIYALLAIALAAFAAGALESIASIKKGSKDQMIRATCFNSESPQRSDLLEESPLPSIAP